MAASFDVDFYVVIYERVIYYLVPTVYIAFSTFDKFITMYMYIVYFFSSSSDVKKSMFVRHCDQVISKWGGKGGGSWSARVGLITGVQFCCGKRE